jgi:hypothetical protein
MAAIIKYRSRPSRAPQPNGTWRRFRMRSQRVRLRRGSHFIGRHTGSRRSGNAESSARVLPNVTYLLPNNRRSHIGGAPSRSRGVPRTRSAAQVIRDHALVVEPLAMSCKLIGIPRPPNPAASVAAREIARTSCSMRPGAVPGRFHGPRIAYTANHATVSDALSG